jgi:diaminopimelate dehydrogenase
MIRTAIIGFGNIGKSAYEAVQTADDMHLAGVILRDQAAAQQKGVPAGVAVAEDISRLGAVDVALLCAPTRVVPDLAAELLAKGINTVDSFDVHSAIYDVKQCLDPIAKQHHATAVIAAGWDPGSDSVIRAWLEAMSPRGLTYTNFGPGMSMGHTVAAKAIPGIKDALSVTIPLGAGLHRRMVYIVPADGEDKNRIRQRLLSDPYFANDETHAIFTDDIATMTDRGSAADITRKAASGTTDNQLFHFSMHINNPALTGQMLVSAARAAVKQPPGCYTLIEIPVIDLLAGDKENLIKRLV